MQSAKFCKSTHTADAGVSGVCDFAEIVHHLMAVVGAERDEMIDRLRRRVNGLHCGVHINITVEVVRFVKIPLSVLLDVAEMDEMNPRAHLGQDRGNIVFRIRTKRAAANA